MGRQKLRLFLCLALVGLLVGSAAGATKSLTLGTVTGREVTLPVTMTSDEDVQGFVLSVAVDTTRMDILDVRAAGATVDNGAELIVPEILPEGFTLGVVMDFDPPYNGQVIPAGTDLLIAEADLSSKLIVPCMETEEVPVVFQDGLNQPPLNNILVVGGMSISQLEGLELNNGKVIVPGTCDTVRIVSTTGAQGATQVEVPVEVDNNQPVEGYVLCIQHPTDITLAEITTEGTDAAAAGVEFEVAKIYPDGGTLGVVLDFDPPYNGQTIPVGEHHSLAKFIYEKELPCSEKADPTEDAVTYDLVFVDNVFGDPPLSNVLVEGGMSISPTLENGTVTFVPGPCVDIEWYVDGAGDLPCAEGPAGACSPVSFYYTSKTYPIQGLSMAVCFPSVLDVCDLDDSGQGIVGDKHLEGTITEGLNAEFVSFNADNDKGELVIGILVDATPPIPINHMYPPTETPQKVINIYFWIPDDQECGTCYDITFCEPAFGAGQVPIYNRAAVFNESLSVITHDGCLCVGGKAIFIRGDCNTDQQVDIADPAATMSYLYLGVYDPSCLDACDANDDGMVDLADVVATLNYLFKLAPALPEPGPYPPGGYDPTPDAYGLDLGCEAGNPCE